MRVSELRLFATRDQQARRRGSAGVAWRALPAAAAAARAELRTATTPPPGQRSVAAPAVARRDPAEPELLRHRSALQARRAARLGRRTEIRERLDRGLVAVAADGGRVYLSWRLLQTDPPDVAFNVYRSAAGAPANAQRASRFSTTTDFLDAAAARDRSPPGACAPVVNGRELAPAGAHAASERADPGVSDAIKLRDDVKSVDRVGIGDLNGDGTYDFVVKHPVGQHRSRARACRARHLQDRRVRRPHRRVPVAHRPRMEHQSRHLVLADGRARPRRRRQGGGVPADGAVRGDARGDVRSRTSRSSSKAPSTSRSTPARPARRSTRSTGSSAASPTDWADHSGNRSSRHMMGVAYLDGKTPSVLVVRGTYGLMKVDAWTLRERQAAEGLALDQRAGAVQVPGPGPAQHQGRATSTATAPTRS